MSQEPETRKIRFRHRAEYAAVRGVGALVRMVPRRVALWIGSAIGLSFYLLDGPHRRLTLDNLAAAFPLRPADERRRIARRVFAHFGRLLVEVLRFSTMPVARMRELVEIEGEERVPQAHALGRGVLFVTGHFGFWELHALIHGEKVGPINVVARALDNPLLHDLLERARTRTGNNVIYRRGGLRRILRALSQNQGVAILIDQHIHGTDSVVVEFFNRPAATTSAVASLALRSGAPIIPVFALPLPNGRYRLVYEHAVPPPPDDSPDPVRELTQRCTDVLEMYVRRHPELWLWMHRRWRDIQPPPSTRGMFPEGRDDAGSVGEGDAVEVRS